MTKPSILVVDDKENMLKLLLRVLGETYDVSLAPDGERALEMVAERTFDLVLSDVRMPGKDGIEVLRAVKARAPETEVVLMTAYGTIEHAVEAVKLGAYDYVTKPFEPDDLVLVISRALEQRRRRDTLSPPAEAATDEAPAEALEGLSYREALERERERVSRRYLSALLKATHGNVTRASERAGLERESLHRLLRRYGVKSDGFKDR